MLGNRKGPQIVVISRFFRIYQPETPLFIGEIPAREQMVISDLVVHLSDMWPALRSPRCWSSEWEVVSLLDEQTTGVNFGDERS